MTIIAAITDGKAAHVASDSQETDEYGGTKRLDCKKIFHVKNDWVWGACGDCVIENILNSPDMDNMWVNADDDPYFLREWVVEAWENLGMEPYRDIIGAPEPGAHVVPQDILFAKKGKIWLVDGQGFQREIKPGVFWAVGSGHVIGIGAAHALMAAGIAGRPIVEAAVSAAIARDIYCGGDIQYVCV